MLCKIGKRLYAKRVYGFGNQNTTLWITCQKFGSAKKQVKQLKKHKQHFKLTWKQPNFIFIIKNCLIIFVYHDFFCSNQGMISFIDVFIKTK
jgi:uncharacterized membrane protein YesL